MIDVALCRLRYAVLSPVVTIELIVDQAVSAHPVLSRTYAEAYSLLTRRVAITATILSVQ